MSSTGDFIVNTDSADNPPDEAEIDEMLAAFGGRKEDAPMTWEDLISEIEEMLED